MKFDGEPGAVRKCRLIQSAWSCRQFRAVADISRNPQHQHAGAEPFGIRAGQVVFAFRAAASCRS